MRYRVVVLPEAKEDLVETFRYIAAHDSLSNADAVLDSLEEKCASLYDNPLRGHAVPELQRVHVEGFREVHVKPFCIIFQVSGKSVYVHAVLDGRREIQEILERRVLR